MSGRAAAPEIATHCRTCGQPLLLRRPGRELCARCRAAEGLPDELARLDPLPLTDADRGAITTRRARYTTEEN